MLKRSRELFPVGCRGDGLAAESLPGSQEPTRQDHQQLGRRLHLGRQEVAAGLHHGGIGQALGQLRREDEQGDQAAVAFDWPTRFVQALKTLPYRPKLDAGIDRPHSVAIDPHESAEMAVSDRREGLEWRRLCTAAHEPG